jgi:hypothetical protein
MSKLKVPESFAAYVRSVCKKATAPTVVVGDLTVVDLVKINNVSVKQHFKDEGRQGIPEDFMELVRVKRKDLISSIQNYFNEPH